MTPEQRIELAEKLRKQGAELSYSDRFSMYPWRIHEDGVTMYTDDYGALQLLQGQEPGCFVRFNEPPEQSFTKAEEKHHKRWLEKLYELIR